MYKKITHTIVEEHFDHPVSAKIKSSIDKRLGVYEVKSQIPTTEILNYNQYLSDVNSFTNNYSTKLTSMIDTINGTKAEFITKFEELMAVADNLGNLTKPLWYSEFGEQINLAMRSLVVYTALAIHSAEVGGDITYYRSRVTSILNELANSIITYNSSLSASDVRQALNLLAEDIVQKLQATADNKPESAQLTTSIIGIFNRLGDIIANSAKTRFPDRFTYS